MFTYSAIVNQATVASNVSTNPVVSGRQSRTPAYTPNFKTKQCKVYMDGNARQRDVSMSASINGNSFGTLKNSDMSIKASKFTSLGAFKKSPQDSSFLGKVRGPLTMTRSSRVNPVQMNIESSLNQSKFKNIEKFSKGSDKFSSTDLSP